MCLQMLSILEQIKNRRNQLGFKQADMFMRIGMSRQQYQKLESQGNPRLDTLEMIVKGMKSNLLLVPDEKISKVLEILEADSSQVYTNKNQSEKFSHSDPWKGILTDDA